MTRVANALGRSVFGVLIGALWGALAPVLVLIALAFILIPLSLVIGPDHSVAPASSSPQDWSLPLAILKISIGGGALIGAVYEFRRSWLKSAPYTSSYRRPVAGIASRG